MDINNYFKNIAISHIDILHTEENKSFFREYSSATIILDSTFHNNLRYAGNNVLISQFNDDSQLPTPASDFNRNSESGSLYVLSRIIDKDTEAARLKAKELRDDILAKIKQDVRNNNGFEPHFVFDNISSHTIGRIADNFFAIIINFSFSNKFANTYNSEKWT